jgi:hypothetical protein
MSQKLVGYGKGRNRVTTTLPVSVTAGLRGPVEQARYEAELARQRELQRELAQKEEKVRKILVGIIAAIVVLLGAWLLFFKTRNCNKVLILGRVLINRRESLPP